MAPFGRSEKEGHLIGFCSQGPKGRGAGCNFKLQLAGIHTLSAQDSQSEFYLLCCRRRAESAACMRHASIDHIPI